MLFLYFGKGFAICELCRKSYEWALIHFRCSPIVLLEVAGLTMQAWHFIGVFLICDPQPCKSNNQYTVV